MPEIVFAALFTAFGVALTSGLITSTPTHQGGGAAIAVLLMTVPVLFARRWPVEAAAALAFGAALNWLVIGHMVRCGAALPAVFFVAFMLGARAGRRDRVIGMGFLVVSLFCQTSSDPQLVGPQDLLLFVPVAVGFLFAGGLLRSRNTVIAGLRARTAELREQRERNAELAVAADRERIAGELDDFLREGVDRIAVTAEAGRATLDTEPAGTQAAFVAIQDTGRQTLSQMREVVRGLRDGAPTEPQPVLGQLDRLLGEATAADARLTVTGDPRLLPAGRRAVRLPHRGASPARARERRSRADRGDGRVRPGRTRADGCRPERAGIGCASRVGRRHRACRAARRLAPEPRPAKGAVRRWSSFRSSPAVRDLIERGRRSGRDHLDALTAVALTAVSFAILAALGPSHLA